MKALGSLHNRIVAAFMLLFLLCTPIFAQSTDLDALFNDLLTADAESAPEIEDKIWREWSKSGSPAMDLLLQRGRDAMAQGMPEIAIEHLTALTDHAPDFAEGWNARATAYYMAGDLGPSVADIAHVLSLNPRHFGALSGLAAIFEELNRPEQALEVYRSVLAIHPNSPGIMDAITRLEAQRDGKEL